MPHLGALGWYALAAFFELAGCAAVWSWRRGQSAAWLLALGTVSLIAFALALAQSPAAVAGRAFAAYAGVYLAGRCSGSGQRTGCVRIAGICWGARSLWSAPP